MTEDAQVPSLRAEVDQRWVAVVQGTLSREAVHAWASSWVEGDLGNDLSPVVMLGLQRLHGFDLTAEGDGRVEHGGEAPHLYSEADLKVGLERWRDDCAQYDRDPQGWVEHRVQRAREEMDRLRGAAGR